MTKSQIKTLKSQKNQANYTFDTLLEYKPTKKSRQQINQEYYQKNKEKRNNQEKERYAKKKQQEREQLNKYYQAKHIKVLMSLKDYTELNSEKRKLWANFCWTLKDFNEDMKENISDIVGIMKLVQVSDNLVRDYWETAKISY